MISMADLQVAVDSVREEVQKLEDENRKLKDAVRRSISLLQPISNQQPMVKTTSIVALVQQSVAILNQAPK